MSSECPVQDLVVYDKSEVRAVQAETLGQLESNTTADLKVKVIIYSVILLRVINTLVMV